MKTYLGDWNWDMDRVWLLVRKMKEKHVLNIDFDDCQAENVFSFTYFRTLENGTFTCGTGRSTVYGCGTFLIIVTGYG